MAFTESFLPYSRSKYFRFFVDGLNASMEENFIPSFGSELKAVSLHLSIAHVSIVDFIIRLSSTRGSAYNLKLISQAMLGVQDFIWTPGSTQLFEMGDTLNFSMTMSGANRYGLLVEGWAVI
jgi:hypothetical protein